MTKISPFKALRPVRDKVHLVATRPYYSYKPNVLKAKLEDNPFTLLRIINPEFGTKKKTAPNSVERFELVKEKYAEFIAEGILTKDKEAHIYIYRQTKDGHEFTGFIGGASIEEYENDRIKKHEATLTSRENMFIDYLDIVGQNAEPVLLSYPHSVELEHLLVKGTSIRPEYEFTTTDRVKHELWILSSDDSQRVANAFDTLDAVYIADGHHRSASSAGLKRRRESNPLHFPNEDFFLAYFIDETRLKIVEFNRMVKTLNGLSTEEFVQRLTYAFEVKRLNERHKPNEEHILTMYMNHQWYELTCKPEIIEKEHPVRSLDAEILTQHVLQPILGINDLKTDDRIEFASGVEELEWFEKQVDTGKMTVAFILFPITMDQVKKVADNQLIMPPKSTWVEPKLRSGLTIYTINE